MHEKKSLVQAASSNQNLSHLVRIAIGRRSPIFEVAASFFGHVPRDANRATAVGYTRRKIVNRAGFVQTSQPTFVVFALVRVIGLDVADVMAGQFVDGSFQLA